MKWAEMELNHLEEHQPAQSLWGQQRLQGSTQSVATLCLPC